MAAAQISCLESGSFEARGKWRFLVRSEREIMETRFPSLSTMGSLPFFDLARILLASTQRNARRGRDEVGDHDI